MHHYSREDIIAHRFTSRRWTGYDTVEVDAYLERLAEYVGRMQEELTLHQASERAALDVLQQAQRIADETVAAAQREADVLRRNAAAGLENARQDARSTLDAARAEADRTLLSAQAQAESALERSRSQIAELEAAGAARLDAINRIVEELRRATGDCAADFRSAGSRLVEMADQFECRFDAHTEGTEAHHGGSVELVEERVQVP